MSLHFVDTPFFQLLFLFDVRVHLSCGKPRLSDQLLPEAIHYENPVRVQKRLLLIEIMNSIYQAYNDW